MKRGGGSSCKGYRERGREREKGREAVKCSRERVRSLLVLILAPPVILESQCT